MTDLTESMLAKPTDLAPARGKRAALLSPDRAIQVSSTLVEGEIRGPLGTIDKGTARLFLTEEGLDPEQWEATHYRKIKYGKDMESVKFSYRRRSGFAAAGDLDDIVRLVKTKANRARAKRRKAGDTAYLVALGDMQFGKIDGDGVAGAVERSITYLEQCRERLYELRAKGHQIGHVHIAFLGDHIEGFTSQGGASSWRTPLTLNEQIRLTRRVMYHAVELFAQTSEKVTVTAVPGNHGRVVSANGSQTRYDDSHDTESLIAVSEAVALAPPKFGHVEFFVPRTDEITTVVDVKGTRIAHVHGDRWTKGKAMEWWGGQAFGRGGLEDADLLLSGHYHFLSIEEDGPRTHVQVPALEDESTWFRHKKGVRGNPGIFTALTREGRLYSMEIVR